MQQRLHQQMVAQQKTDPVHCVIFFTEMTTLTVMPALNSGMIECESSRLIRQTFSEQLLWAKVCVWTWDWVYKEPYMVPVFPDGHPMEEQRHPCKWPIEANPEEWFNRGTEFSWEMRPINKSLLDYILQLMVEEWKAQTVTQQGGGKTGTGNHLPPLGKSVKMPVTMSSDSALCFQDYNIQQLHF